MRIALIAVAACGLALSGGGLAQAASRPPGYTVVTVDFLNAPTGHETRASATCPPGTVPFGGGALISAASGTAIKGSQPTATGWQVDVTNTTGVDLPWLIQVVCGTRPPGYIVFTSLAQPNPNGTQSSASVRCPNGTMPLGGGGITSSSSVFTTMNSSFPHRRQ